jgi:hypothetical protein
MYREPYSVWRRSRLALRACAGSSGGFGNPAVALLLPLDILDERRPKTIGRARMAQHLFSRAE